MVTENSTARQTQLIRPTAIGMLALLLWAFLSSLLRTVSNAFGTTGGSALVYSCAFVMLLMFKPPTRALLTNRKYLLISGSLFVFYEAAFALAIGMAANDLQSIEVTMVNYLWPTMSVLLAAAMGSRKTGRPIWRILPGCLIATVGIVLTVGSDQGIAWSAMQRELTEHPLPYALAFLCAVAWSVYTNVTPLLAGDDDATSLFIGLVALALWVIHFATGNHWVPGGYAAPTFGALVALVGAAVVIAAGYASWNYGMVHGNLTTLTAASYATPVLSAGVSAIVLAVMPSTWFWLGVVLVAAGSALCQWYFHAQTATES